MSNFKNLHFMRTGAAPSGLLRILGSSTLRRVESPDGATYETGLIISQVDPEQCQCPCNCDCHRLGGRGIQDGCIHVDIQRGTGPIKLSRGSQLSVANNLIAVESP
jgi:hypothetical protein